VHALLEILDRDNLVALRKILAEKNIDFTKEVTIGAEYELDEPDEVALLFYLISNGTSMEAIKMLIDAGMDINYHDRDGVGAVDIAVKYKRLNIIKLCEENGINILNTRRKSGMTPLMLSASFGDIELFKFFLSKGANINKFDKNGMKAIDYATILGHKKVVELIESLNR